MGQDKQTGAGTPAPEWESHYNPADVEKLLEIRADLGRLKGGPQTTADAAELSRRLSEVAARLGAYYLAVPEELLAAGERFYNSHVEALKNALRDGGADADTIAAVAVDYAAALCGMTIQATPAQMKAALNACKPITAYKLDKYGAFLGLFCVYSRRLNVLTEYTKQVKQQPAACQRELYFSREISVRDFSDLRAASLYWLQNIGYITADDFAGLDQAAIRQFLSYVDMYGTNGNFLQYVFIAKNALNATPEQLKQLPPPRLFDYAKISPIQSALNYADIVGEEIALYLQRVSEQIAAADAFGGVRAVQVVGRVDVTKPTAVQVAAENPVINWPEDLALLNSRDLWGAPGPQAEPLPMPAIVADFRKRFPEYPEIESYPVQRAIEAINLLRQSGGARFDGEKWAFEVSISEFSRVAYGFDANETQKRGLLTALKVLNDYYVIVWRKRGRVAVKLLTVREAELDKGEHGKMKIEVYKNALKGRPNFISFKEYQTMKKTVTGESKSHFLFQVIQGNNKTEQALITEVFGYDTKKNEAERSGGPEQLAAVREYERLHRPRDRKYILKWFEEWAALGLISYKRYQNKKREWVYKWKRLKPLTPEERATIAAVRKQYNLPE